MNVLIIDDSVVFRSQIKSAISDCPEFDVIETAANGKIAISKLGRTSFDLVILDLEMPEMNGIETLQEMRKLNYNVPTIVFSSLTARGADITMEALQHGAKDFVTKPNKVNNLEEALGHVKEQLIPKALQFVERKKKILQNVANSSVTFQSEPIKPSLPKNLPSKEWRKVDPKTFMPKACVIGSSTGGPVALKQLFANVSLPIRFPIFITQHMPPIFTKSLAATIQELTGVPTKEAVHNEEVVKDCIYIAPGDYHMTVKSLNNRIITVLDKKEKRNSVRPAVDFLFESAAEVYGRQTLGFVLTGMGSDGMEGSKALKDVDACVVIQDEETSTVWGMPGSVYRASAYDHMTSLEECANLLQKHVKGFI